MPSPFYVTLPIRYAILSQKPVVVIFVKLCKDNILVLPQCLVTCLPRNIYNHATSYSSQKCSDLIAHCTSSDTNLKSPLSFSLHTIILHHVLCDIVYSICQLTSLKVVSLLAEGLQQFVHSCATVSVRKPEREWSNSDSLGFEVVSQMEQAPMVTHGQIQRSQNILLTYPLCSSDPCLLAPE